MGADVPSDIITISDGIAITILIDCTAKDVRGNDFVLLVNYLRNEYGATKLGKDTANARGENQIKSLAPSLSPKMCSSNIILEARPCQL